MDREYRVGIVGASSLVGAMSGTIAPSRFASARLIVVAVAVEPVKATPARAG